MVKGLYTAYTGMINEQKRLDVLSNNLANADTNGYKINEMKDGSRVVVVRPSMSETWAFFVRKFDVKRATLEQIVLYPGKEDTIDLLKFLVKGARIISLTGEQGCRKNNNAYGND